MLSNLKIFVASATDTPSLWEMAGQTKVIASSAGPFSLYGSNLVASCAGQNTDYCDITGEIDWIRDMIAKNAKQAAASGARIVFSTAADSVPWDLATFLLEKKLRSNGEDMVKIEHFNEGKGKFSGGTLKTILLKVDGNVPNRKKDDFDPLVGSYDLDSDSFEQSVFKTKNKSDKCVSGKDKRLQKYTAISPLANGNSAIIKRSNALLGYNIDLAYREVWATESCINNFNYYSVLLYMATIFLFRPLRYILLKLGALPSPGEGPSEDFMKTNYLILDSIGTGSTGSTISLRTTYNEDIAYIDTARMMVESALCFVFQNNQCVQTGGMYTPASCFGKILKKRLEQSGTKYEFDVLENQGEKNVFHQDS